MRLLANPEVLKAICNHFRKNFDNFSGAFYTLLETQLEVDEDHFEFTDDITYFCYDYDTVEVDDGEHGVGDADGNEGVGTLKNSTKSQDPRDTLIIQSMSSGIYVKLCAEDDKESPDVEIHKISKVSRFILKCIENATYLGIKDAGRFKSMLKDDNVVLDPPPSPKNQFLCTKTGNTLSGGFYFSSDPFTRFRYLINVVDVESKTYETVVEGLGEDKSKENNKD